MMPVAVEPVGPVFPSLNVFLFGGLPNVFTCKVPNVNPALKSSAKKIKPKIKRVLLVWTFTSASRNTSRTWIFPVAVRPEYDADSSGTPRDDFMLKSSPVRVVWREKPEGKKTNWTPNKKLKNEIWNKKKNWKKFFFEIK